MNFNQLVLQESDDKYQNMLHDETPEAFDGNIWPDECGEYDRKRKAYLARLEKEQTKFNSAIKTIKKTRADRLSEEASVQTKQKADNKALRPIRLVFYIMMSAILLLTFIPIRLGVADLVQHYVFGAIGFPVFFNPERAPVPFYLSIALGVLGAIIALIAAGKKDSDTFWGVLFFSGLIGGVLFLAARLVIALLAYISYVLVCPFILPIIGLTALILISVFGKKLQMQPAKTRRVIMILLTIAITGVCSYLSFTVFM